MIDARHRRRWASSLPWVRFLCIVAVVSVAMNGACVSPNQATTPPVASSQDTQPPCKQIPDEPEEVVKQDSAAKLSPTTVEAVEEESTAAPPQATVEAEVAAEPDEPKPQDVVDTPKGKAYRLWFKYHPGDTLYYTIENKLRDTGGVPPLLTYTTSIEDRRFITQHILPPTPEQKNTATLRRLVSVSWECDRYDVREVGMKDEYSFDSLRHAYPPSPIRRLGGIPGSTSTFLLNPKTGEPTRVRVQLAAVNGGSGGRSKLSKIAEKVQLSITNLKELLDDIGPYYLPSRSVRVGEQWVRTLTETHKTFGTITTKVTCTLDSVREVEGRNIATILIDGVISIQKKQKSEKEDTTTEAATSQPAKKSSPKEYRIEKQECSGKVEFDITRGELIELTLRREREFVADVDAEKTSGLVTEIRQATSRELRVRTSHTAPRHPTIVGGPKPPIEPIGAPTLNTPPIHTKPVPRKTPPKPRRRRPVEPVNTSMLDEAAKKSLAPELRMPDNQRLKSRMRNKSRRVRKVTPTSQPAGSVKRPSRDNAETQADKQTDNESHSKQLPKGTRRGSQPMKEGRVSSRPYTPEKTEPKTTSAPATSQPARESES